MDNGCAKLRQIEFIMNLKVLLNPSCTKAKAITFYKPFYLVQAINKYKNNIYLFVIVILYNNLSPISQPIHQFITYLSISSMQLWANWDTSNKLEIFWYYIFPKKKFSYFVNIKLIINSYYNNTIYYAIHLYVYITYNIIQKIDDNKYLNLLFLDNRLRKKIGYFIWW